MRHYSVHPAAQSAHGARWFAQLENALGDVEAQTALLAAVRDAVQRCRWCLTAQHRCTVPQVFHPLVEGQLPGVDAGAVQRLLRALGDAPEVCDDACAIIAGAAAGAAGALASAAPHVQLAAKAAAPGADLVHIAVPLLAPPPAPPGAAVPLPLGSTAPSGVLYDEDAASAVRSALAALPAGPSLPAGTPLAVSAALPPAALSYLPLRVRPVFSELALQVWPASHALADAGAEA